MKPFEHVDHPLIIAFQIGLFIGLIRLFFAIRRDPFPLPQIIGLMAFAVIANLTARTKHWDWFYISDIAQYGLWTASAWASVFAVDFRKKKEALLPGAPKVVTDFFDKWENKITWGLGALAVSVGLWAYLSTYSDLQSAKADAVVKADSAVVATTQEYKCQQQETSQQQQVILDTIGKLTAKTNRLLRGQRIDSTQHKTTQGLIAKKAKQTQQTVREAAQDKETDKSTPKSNDDEKPKRNLWQKAKDFLHLTSNRAPFASDIPDSLQYVRAVSAPDSTLLH